MEIVAPGEAGRKTVDGVWQVTLTIGTVSLLTPSPAAVRGLLPEDRRGGGPPAPSSQQHES